MRVAVTHVAGGQLLQHLQQLAAVSLRAACLLPVNLGAPFGAKLGDLGVEGLPVGADAGIAETTILRF
jgi:hypothetical protein